MFTMNFFLRSLTTHLSITVWVGGLDRAFSSIGAIGAIGLGPPQNGGLQILHIWSFFVMNYPFWQGHTFNFQKSRNVKNGMKELAIMNISLQNVTQCVKFGGPHFVEGLGQWLLWLQ